MFFIFFLFLFMICTKLFREKYKFFFSDTKKEKIFIYKIYEIKKRYLIDSSLYYLKKE